MPKETIHSLHEADGFDVKVGWHPDGNLQVGLEQAAGFSIIGQLYGDPATLRKIQERIYELVGSGGEVNTGEVSEDIGRRILHVIECSATSPTGSYSSVWASLDRGGVNRLIKTLRRARDAAFGRDE